MTRRRVLLLIRSVSTAFGLPATAPGPLEAADADRHSAELLCRPALGFSAHRRPPTCGAAPIHPVGRRPIWKPLAPREGFPVLRQWRVDLENVVQGILLYFVLPLWVLVGAADALCHKICRIELTTGPLETVIHLLMAAEIGAAVLAALFLQINGAVLTFLAALWVLHEATSYWDLHYASSRRAIPPGSNGCMIISQPCLYWRWVLVSLLAWGQLLAIFGLGPEQFDGRNPLQGSPAVAHLPCALPGLDAPLQPYPLCFRADALHCRHRKRETRRQSLRPLEPMKATPIVLTAQRHEQGSNKLHGFCTDMLPVPAMFCRSAPVRFMNPGNYFVCSEG